MCCARYRTSLSPICTKHKKKEKTTQQPSNKQLFTTCSATLSPVRATNHRTISTSSVCAMHEWCVCKTRALDQTYIIRRASRVENPKYGLFRASVFFLYAFLLGQNKKMCAETMEKRRINSGGHKDPIFL